MSQIYPEIKEREREKEGENKNSKKYLEEENNEVQLFHEEDVSNISNTKLTALAWSSFRKDQKKEDKNENKNEEKKLEILTLMTTEERNHHEKHKHRHHHHHHHHHHQKRKEENQIPNQSIGNRDSENQRELDLETGSKDIEFKTREEQNLKSMSLSVDRLYHRVRSDVDALSQFITKKEDDPVLESIAEILFKSYPFSLQLFAGALWICQFLTLLALFWSLLPCPSRQIDWSVIVGLPLCCGYGSFFFFLFFI